MILLLGKNKYVEQYAKNVLQIDLKKDIVYCPNIITHYTEYDQELIRLQKMEPLVITSQNIEFINYLLDSDLIFEVYTVYENNATRILSKEKAVGIFRDFGLELR